LKTIISFSVNITESLTYFLGFTGLLDRMLKNSEIDGDLKNLNKQIFTKFEAFIGTKIRSRINLDDINQALQGNLNKLALKKNRPHQDS